jgi:hypothetical protein
MEVLAGDIDDRGRFISEVNFFIKINLEGEI